MESTNAFYRFDLSHDLIRKMGPFFKDHAVEPLPSCVRRLRLESEGGEAVPGSREIVCGDIRPSP
jgi:hypothetical protein